MSIFITGNSRSGTTMVSRILGNHSEVFAFQELHFFDELVSSSNYQKTQSYLQATNLYAKLCSIQRNGYFGSHNSSQFILEAQQVLDKNAIYTSIDVFTKFLFDESKINGKSIPCEQTPQNIFAIEEILKSIPDSKIIVMVRDPREVLLSQKFKWKRRKLSGGKIPFWESVRSRINYHPVTISKIWNAAILQGLKFNSDPRVLHVQYENLLQNPEIEVAALCKHVGINYFPSLLEIPIVGSSNQLDASKQKGIDKNKLGKWKNGGLNKTEIFICEKINGAIMSQFGYQNSNLKSNPFLTAGYYLLLPFQLALSLLFNLKRFKNPRKLWNRVVGTKES